MRIAINKFGLRACLVNNCTVLKFLLAVLHTNTDERTNIELVVLALLLQISFLAVVVFVILLDGRYNVEVSFYQTL